MKPEDQTGPEESLQKSLRRWEVNDPLPPRFREQVWQRIAQADAQAGETVWARLLRLIEVALPRPKVALSYLAALMIVGVVAGSLTAQMQKDRFDASLSLRYVQSLDPFASNASQP
jgi:hypothetical protein